MCGEQLLANWDAALTAGSSPRVRGTGFETAKKGEEDGIIPACAGNSNYCHIAIHHFRDHPRVCGEQGGWSDELNTATGSSPRVRGTVSRRIAFLYAGGIIPACAGNSAYLHGHGRDTWDHPRVCGEQCQIVQSAHAPVGSSPRVRGTVLMF